VDISFREPFLHFIHGMTDRSILFQKILGVNITPSQLNCLEMYEKELLKWNKQINLTAIKEPEQIWVRHFVDSISCINVMRETSMERVIDVGTGAGFPGIPLKIINPTMELTLVESVGKKADFCRHLVRILELDQVRVIQARVETIGRIPEHRQKYDWAIARAVANMSVLVEYLLPLVRVGGCVLAMKGESALVEIQDSEHATHLLGGHFRRITPIELPGVAEERYLVVFDKIAATPEKYPRRIGVPSKHPLRTSR